VHGRQLGECQGRIIGLCRLVTGEKAQLLQVQESSSLISSPPVRSKRKARRRRREGARPSDQYDA
jgi:hypothetical protein